MREDARAEPCFQFSTIITGVVSWLVASDTGSEAVVGVAACVLARYEFSASAAAGARRDRFAGTSHAIRARDCLFG